MKNSLIALFFILSFSTQAQSYVFFLHNKFLEEHSIEDAHPEYGKCEYNEILAAFKKAGFHVISELRPKQTNVNLYAAKVVKQIDSLLSRKIKPGQITVIGTSKGGYIAQAVSRLLKNDKVNFVFIGSCSKEDLQGTAPNTFYGNILSIYEKSDTIGQSCQEIKNKSAAQLKHYKEISLNTGLKHGFLFKALPQWIEPCLKWARQHYD